MGDEENETKKDLRKFYWECSTTNNNRLSKETYSYELFCSRFNYWDVMRLVLLLSKTKRLGFLVKEKEALFTTIYKKTRMLAKNSLFTKGKPHKLPHHLIRSNRSYLKNEREVYNYLCDLIIQIDDTETDYPTITNRIEYILTNEYLIIGKSSQKFSGETIINFTCSLIPENNVIKNLKYHKNEIKRSNYSTLLHTMVSVEMEAIKKKQSKKILEICLVLFPKMNYPIQTQNSHMRLLAEPKLQNEDQDSTPLSHVLKQASIIESYYSIQMNKITFWTRHSSEYFEQKGTLFKNQEGLIWEENRKLKLPIKQKGILKKITKQHIDMANEKIKEIAIYLDNSMEIRRNLMNLIK